MTPNSKASDRMAFPFSEREQRSTELEEVASSQVKTVTILLPTLNEEEAIGNVLDEIPAERLRSMGFAVSVLVVDGHSTDGTALIAARRGARILGQTGSGKGWAVRTGLEKSDGDYLVMLDADFSYPADRIPDFLNRLANGADVVVGSRLRGHVEEGAMRPINVLGNRLLSLLASTLYGHAISDVCSGMWAFGPSAMKALSLDSIGFEVEAEIFAMSVKQRLVIEEIPIVYRRRKGEAKLGGIAIGLRIAVKLVTTRFMARRQMS